MVTSTVPGLGVQAMRIARLARHTQACSFNRTLCHAAHDWGTGMPWAASRKSSSLGLRMLRMRSDVSQCKGHAQPRARPHVLHAHGPDSHKAGEPQTERWHRLLSFVSAALLAIGLLWGTPNEAQAQRFPFRPGTQAPTQIMEIPDDRLPELSGEERETVELFQRATPSVVNIANIVSRQDVYMNQAEIPQGQGSGFIWDTKGHVVTNFHVIRGASNIKVTLIDQTTWPAKFIAGDPDKDVAVLQLQCPEEKAAELKPVRLGTSANLLVGQKVFALGNPFGLDHSMTQGIVSGVGRELSSPGARGIPIKNVIQTDAAINPGNSGGVLLDSKGRLVGINTAIADPTGRGASSGVGFAIPVDQVRGLVQQALTYGKIVRPVLGVSIAPPQTLRQLGLDGVLVLEVPQGTPAAKAGIQGTYRDSNGKLRLGDVIVGIDGKEVKLQRDLFEQLDERRPGDKITVDVVRDGDKSNMVSIQVELGSRELAGPAD